MRDEEEDAGSGRRGDAEKEKTAHSVLPLHVATPLLIPASLFLPASPCLRVAASAFILHPSSFILCPRFRPAQHAYAGDGVTGRDFAQVWIDLRTLGNRFGAARVEAAT
jgi:hypothetical protein